jgi:MFS family permease
MAWIRPVAFVFLPFAAGYFLSYLFRVVNAVIAGPLAAELGLGATQLGFLTSAYFLTFAAVQLPLGAALDRYGAQRVQAVLLLLAAGGAATFALARGFPALLVGRALIGLGVAGSLISGLKVIADTFPRERLPLVNGAYIAIGAAGAVTATAPAAWLLTLIDWRQLFLLLAGLTAAVSVLVLLVVRAPAGRPAAPGAGAAAGGLRSIYTDARFWRLAPLSALCLGSSWALQGLWAAPWLADVAGLCRTEIVQHLFIMALALCAGALLMGLASDALRRRGIGPDTMLTAAAGTFIAAELALVCRLPVPCILLWVVVAAMGAATVLSYSLLAGFFRREAAGRANAALNFLHIGAAFAIQAAIGVVIGFCGRTPAGGYPTHAYETAFWMLIVLQSVALAWFLLPRCLPSSSRAACAQTAPLPA